MFGQAKKNAERRVQPRRRVLWGSWIAALDGAGLVQCQTRDFSPGGARISLDEQRAAPGQLCFLDLRHRLAYESRVAWRQMPELGLEFLKVYRFDEAPPALQGVIAALCQ